MAGWCFKLSPDHFHKPPVPIPVTYLSIRDFISAVIRTHKFRFICHLYAVRGRDVTPGIVVYQQFWFRTYIKNSPISRTYGVRMLRIEHIGIWEFISCMVFLENLWSLIRPLGNNSHVYVLVTKLYPWKWYWLVIYRVFVRTKNFCFN
jgi:hypothetical protein